MTKIPRYHSRVSNGEWRAVSLMDCTRDTPAILMLTNCSLKSILHSEEDEMRLECRTGEYYIFSHQQTSWVCNPEKNAPQFPYLTSFVLQDISAYFVFLKAPNKQWQNLHRLFYCLVALIFVWLPIYICMQAICLISVFHDFCHCNVFMTVSPAHYQTAPCEPSIVFSMSDLESKAYFFSLNIFLCRTLT